MAEDKRAKILDTAFRLISELGFHGMSMGKLSKVSGVAIGTIYHHFSGKEEMINVLYLELKGQVTRAIVEGVNEELPIKERLWAMWSAIVNYYLENKEAFYFMEQFNNSPYLTQKTLEEQERMVQRKNYIVGDAVAQGVIRALPEPLLVSLYYGPLSVLVKEHHKGSLVLDEGLSREAFEACWRAVKA